MNKVLSAGGLGDALMIYSKLLNLDGDIELTHAMKVPKLMPVVKEFYETVGVNVKMQKIGNWNWIKNNKDNFDYHLDTSWIGEDCGIESYPWLDLKVKEKYDFDIVMTPSSGRDNERHFHPQGMLNFIKKYKDKKIVFIGVESNPNRFNNYGVTNLLNKTSIQKTIDIVSGSKYVVAPSGFISFLGCFLGKKVFSKDGRRVIENRYYHPKWNNTFIQNLNQVQL